MISLISSNTSRGVSVAGTGLALVYLDSSSDIGGNRVQTLVDGVRSPDEFSSVRF